jgi:hypothetical protein
MEAPVATTLYRFTSEDETPKILDHVGIASMRQGCSIPFFSEREDAWNFKLEECLALLLDQLDQKSYHYLEIYFHASEKDVAIVKLVSEGSTAIIVKSDKQKRQIKRLACEVVRYLCNIHQSEGELLEEAKQQYEKAKPKLIKRFDAIKLFSLA